VALVQIKENKTMTNLAEQFQDHPPKISKWNKLLLARVADVFRGITPPSKAPTFKALHAKIGQPTVKMIF